MTLCALIPAAGEGRRLGSSLPKILVPVTDGKTAWQIIHGKLAPLVDHMHVVLSPQGERLFQQEYGALDNVGTSVQPMARGMGDAIFGAYDYWKRFSHLLIMWGDQINVSSQTLRAVVASLQVSSSESLTIAINWVDHPYVQFDFNEDRSILIDIRHSREGDRCDAKGFQDVGVFGLSTKFLMKAWEDYLKNPSLGKETKEINFLPFLVYLSKDLHWPLNLVEVKDPLESRGINTAEDLEFFRKNSKNEY